MRIWQGPEARPDREFIFPEEGHVNCFQVQGKQIGDSIRSAILICLTQILGMDQPEESFNWFWHLIGLIGWPYPAFSDSCFLFCKCLNLKAHLGWLQPLGTWKLVFSGYQFYLLLMLQTRVAVRDGEADIRFSQSLSITTSMDMGYAENLYETSNWIIRRKHYIFPQCCT